MVSLRIRAVTKAKDGEMELAQTAWGQLLPQEAFPERVGIGRDISLTSCGGDKDRERVLDQFFLRRQMFVNSHSIQNPMASKTQQQSLSLTKDTLSIGSTDVWNRNLSAASPISSAIS